MVQYIKVNELKTLIEKGNCQLIDVREVQEYQAIRISNSVLVPLSGFEQKMNLIDKNSPSYYLCSVGKRALKVAEYLESIGYENLYVVEDGIKAWLEAGYPVECN